LVSLRWQDSHPPVRVESQTLWENPMRSDTDIKRDVEAELKWDPDIDANRLTIAA